MSGATLSIRRPNGDLPVRALLPLLAAAVMTAAALTAIATRAPLPPAPMIAAGGLAMLALLALAVVRYEIAVALGIATMAIVKIEPAPPDLIFSLVMAVALVTGRMNLARVPAVASWLTAAFIALNVLSAIDLVSASRAAFYFSITLYLAVFALWFADYLDRERRAATFVRVYLFVAVVSAALSVAAFAVPFPGAAGLIDNADTRAAGLFKDPNVFGPFLIPILLITIEELLRPRLLRLSAPLKLLSILALTLGVLFSFSRAAWVSLALGLVAMAGVMAMRRGGGRQALVITSVVVIGVVASAGTLYATGSLDFLEERAGLQSYDDNRFESQAYGIELAEENPLGRGPGQFDELAPIAAHSTYVRVLAEQGVLGFATLVALFGATLVYAFANAAAGRSTWGIGSAALLGAWAGLMLNSVVVDTLHWRHLWLVAALIWAGTIRGRGRAPAGAQPASSRLAG